MNNFFGDGSPYLNHPLLTAERTMREIDFLLGCMALSTGCRILDVGCGFGRHSIELARRGFAVVGIDPSAAMVAAARQRAAAANVVVAWQQIGGEQFESAQRFDAALCLFTTLGQMTNGQDNGGLLARAFAALANGGHFFVELPQRAVKLRETPMAERFGGGERYTDVVRTWDSAENRFSETFTLVNPDTTRRYQLAYRLYTAPDVRQMLTAAGFTIEAAYAGVTGRPLTDADPMMLFHCRKRAS